MNTDSPDILSSTSPKAASYSPDCGGQVTAGRAEDEDEEASLENKSRRTTKQAEEMEVLAAGQRIKKVLPTGVTPFDEDSDRELMRRIARRDTAGAGAEAEAAFELLYRRYAGVLGAFLVRFFPVAPASSLRPQPETTRPKAKVGAAGNDKKPTGKGYEVESASINAEANCPEVVEEALQEVFMRLWRAASQWRAESKVSTYLFQIAKNEGLSALRKRLREKSRRGRLFLQEARKTRDEKETATPDATAAHRERLQAVRRAVRELPEELRTVLVLNSIEGLSFRRISELTGTPVGTLKSRLAAALAALRRSLND